MRLEGMSGGHLVQGPNVHQALQLYIQQKCPKFGHVMGLGKGEEWFHSTSDSLLQRDGL